MQIELVNLVVCPKCHHTLELNSDHTALICLHDQLKYPITDGIPQLLAEKAIPLTHE